MDYEVISYDNFQPLADFWELVVNGEGVKIMNEVMNQIPITDRKHLLSFAPLLESEDKFTRAWSFYILIKGSFGGVLGKTSESGRNRITPVAVSKIGSFHNPNLKFQRGDCFTTIPNHINDFMYLDPPYYRTTDYLYGVKGSKHRGFDHQSLASLLKSHKGGFVMSYDNSPEIRKLYEGWTEFRSMDFKYEMHGFKDRRGEITKELVVVKYPSQSDYSKEKDWGKLAAGLVT